MSTHSPPGMMASPSSTSVRADSGFSADETLLSAEAQQAFQSLSARPAPGPIVPQILHQMNINGYHDFLVARLQYLNLLILIERVELIKGLGIYRKKPAWV